MQVGQSGPTPTSNYTSVTETGQTGKTDTDKAIDKLNQQLMDALVGANKNTIPQVQTSVPVLPTPTTFSSTELSTLMGIPSPGALVASLMVDNAAEQRVTNRTTIQAQGEQIAQNIEAQAEKIIEGAVTKFACAVAGAVVNMGAGVASLTVTAQGLTAGMDSTLLGSISQSVNTVISSAGSMISAGGDLGQSISTAAGKKLEAHAERIRVSQELTKQTNEAMRDLISKSLDFMNSMQANTNQTRTKILG